MIDIHSHLLPSIDDGAQTIDDSIVLAKIAVSKGMTHSVITPHIHPGRYDNDKKSIQKAFDCLQKALIKEKIPLKIAYAAEVRISVEMMALIAEQKIPFLGRFEEQDIILLEFPHSHILPGSEKLISWLKKRNIRPIIAHPERNKEIQAEISKVVPLLEAGCFLQVTAGSLVGRFGEKSQKVARQLVERHWADFVASDAHNIKHRPPDLSEAYQYLCTRYDENMAKDLLVHNPWALVKDKFN